MMPIKSMFAGTALAIGLSLATTAQAQCVGTCGTLGADGDVTESPLGGTYQYVTTFDGVAGAGSLGVGEETTGSQNTTGTFSALAGAQLTFYFNYVTSDGAEFTDYGWSQLQTPGGAAVATLFTARTTPSGDTVPGFGLPGLLATLTPASTPILIGTNAEGGPNWSPLGALDTTRCFAEGCGYTGWILATYTIADAGNYRLAFGVTNWDDSDYQTGLAYDGVFVDGEPVNPGVPEPASWALMIAGFGLIGSALRRRRELAIA